MEIYPQDASTETMIVLEEFFNALIVLNQPLSFLTVGGKSKSGHYQALAPEMRYSKLIAFLGEGKKESQQDKSRLQSKAGAFFLRY